ncbi:MAG: transglycosylase domain-containing protein [Oscillospiraceae bacterium]|jgi:penicillin-binding protein 1A|nr:transglycosylase domain-containing protein [Oscillospiraceae bacterium]
MKKNKKAGKASQTAWRIARIALNVLGKIVLVLLSLLGTALLVAAISGSIFMSKLTDYLKADMIPDSEEFGDNLGLDNISLNQTSFIYYTDPQTGEYRELQQLYATENRVWVSYDEIPTDLVNAAVAIEDKRFNEHSGVDWWRTLAAISNFAGGDSSYGASTITQQLIKNITQEDDVTVNRKMQEIFRALAVEERYSKKEIMEWYLNTIYLGEGCYGVQSAAQVYFAKDVSELTTAECASLIAITNNPSIFDPYINEENNRNRQLTILSEMYSQGYIPTEKAYTAAKEQEMVFRNGRYLEKSYECAQCGFTGVKADYRNTEDGDYLCPECETVNHAISSNNYYSYFVDTVYRDVLNDLMEKYGYSELAAAQKILSGGYKIYSTLNPDVQATVDRVYTNLENLPKTVSTQQLQSAIVIVDNETGDIIAMAGGVGEKTGSLTLNRATMSTLPTGSSIKPISVYAPALEAGIITPATAYEDSPYNDTWPYNDSRSYSGTTNVLNGVTGSLNTISVKVLADLGAQNSYDFLTQKMGITTLVDHMETGGQTYSDISLAPLGLGQQTKGLTVREMTQAFAVFPNNGVFREARSYSLVVDAEGKTILDNRQESHTAIGAKANYYVNYMLERATQYGTGYTARLDSMSTAGKTGTSGSNQDRWFAGYTPYYTAVVWCGYDQPEEVVLDGSWTNPAITMWKQVMSVLHEGLENRSFLQPDGVGSYKVCQDSGLLATEACEKDMRGESRAVSIRLFYGDAPTAECNCHVMVKICEESGKIATEFCELAEGNKVTEVGMLLFNEDWKVNRDKDFVIKPEQLEILCDLHTEEEPNTDPTEESTNPTEESTDPTEESTEPTEPTIPIIPPDQNEITDWYGHRRIEIDAWRKIERE